MTSTTYEFTAYTEADLLDAGADGTGVSCGDTFTMSAGATTCIEVTDNDSFLSGDNYSNENANDQYGQQAAITDAATGAELGNGGQIYAEKYFWVCDDAGNWYVMIEIEQEGSNDDFFTFYTGHGYTVPEEGTELTVYSSCNVTGDWVDFKCLDAGDKPETGSISGRVFCDDDCDGIDGGVTVIEGCDYTVEAEDMDAWGFTTVHGEHASGGELVKLQCAGEQAAIKTDFQGKDGVYDISLFIQDETDGQSTVKLLVNGRVVEAIRLDQQSDGVGSNNGGFSEFVIQGVELKAGDEIKLWADGDGHEFVRIDKLEFNGRDEEVRTEEPGKEGVVVVLLDADGEEVLDANGQRIETTTDANGEYTFDGVPVGDYRVKFENPDGTEFTFQNAGSDDAIDSDVDANGVSDVVTVVADQTTSDVDAGLKPLVELGSIAGRYFCDENQDGAETDGAGNFEAGVAGATVWLLLGGNVIASTTTDSDGNYSFTDLEAGNYSVRFEDPDDVGSASEGKNFIAADQGDDATDSDVVDVGGAGNGNTVTFTLGAGENKTDVDAGIEQQFMVCDDPNAVLIDFEGLDSDVGFDAFEAGQVIDNEYSQFGVTITAQRINNNDPANDAMIFDSANPTGGDGDLQTFNQGNLLIVSEDNDSSDPDDAVGGVITFDFENPSRIFDLKVVDTEEGGTIELFDADGNSLGVIDLPNLADGGLEQVMIDTDGVSQMVVTINGSGAIDDICLVPGEAPVGSLSGRYFFDGDRDGLDNDGANGISGIQVELLDENGDPTGDSVMTGADGSYSFGDLAPGTYGVKFTDPDTGRVLTTQDANGNGNDDIDSDASDVGGGMSVINGIVVVADQDTPDNDAGVVELLGSLSGRYFFDTDRDGLDNDGANGIGGILVELLDENGVPTGDSVMTNADGSYSFGDLSAGDYGVKFTDPDTGRELTTQDANGNGNDDIDSDAADVGGGMSAINGITVVAGQDTPDNDAGVVELLGSLSGRYFFDTDRDGLDNDGANGISGIQVELLDENGDPTGVTVMTDAMGNYSFGGLSAGDYGVKFTDPDTGRELTTQNVDMDASDDIDSDAADVGGGMSAINGITVVAGQDTPDNDAGVVELLGSLSGRYFCDDDGDGLDNDGDTGGEGPGVEGITVTLLDANGQPTTMTTTTGPNGGYTFTGLVAGTYGVSFAATPPGKDFTIANVDNDVSDDIDSDAIGNDFGSATINNIVVVGGQDTPDNDVGVTPTNEDPEADDVMAAVCADDMAMINLIDAVSDPDGDMVSVTSISDADETAGVGESITLAGGGVATLNEDGTVSFNPNGAYDDLLIRDMEMDQFSFTAEDGMGGSATATADIKVCGALNTIDTINEGLPDTATVTYQSDGNGAFRVDIDSSDPRLDTDGFTVDVFCVDFDAPFINNARIETNIYASVDPQPDATPDQIDALPDGIVPNEENLDLVNWILNQDFRNMDNGDGTSTNYSGREIQDAIWFLTNDRDVPSSPFNPAGQANSQEIIDFALNDIDMDGVADGGAEGFVAGEDDLVGIILAPALDVNAVDLDTGELIPLDDQPLQPFIVGISFQDLEEFCDCVI